MQRLLGVGLLIILAGFALLVLGSVDNGNVSTGGVVFVGPFPIVFGSGPNGGELALLSLAIGSVMVLLFLLWGWRAIRMKVNP